MTVIINDIEKLVEALRLKAGELRGDLGAGGACRIEREFREVIIANATEVDE